MELIMIAQNVLFCQEKISMKTTQMLQQITSNSVILKLFAPHQKKMKPRTKLSNRTEECYSTTITTLIR